MKPIRYIEIDIPRCQHEYGVAPCTAAIGVTGTHKCYNSPKTCQDVVNYDGSDLLTLRFSEKNADLPVNVDSFPCVTSISRRPYMLDPGESLGVRESVSSTFHNFKDNDSKTDPYVGDRPFNPYNQGTFWGKFLARHGSLEGYELRTIDGFSTQTLGEMTTRHYMIDKVNGADNNGNVSFVAKDALKFVDADKAQFPTPSNGLLLSAITETDTALTLTPGGVGDEYPASGTASIGDEMVTYTRSGDNITLTGRGLRSTTAEEHEANETFQAAEIIDSENPAYILNLLLQQTSLPSDYFDLAAWEEEVDTFLARLYSADIMKPTPVKQLLEELVRECGLIIYPDLVNKKIVLKVLRKEDPVLQVDDGTIIQNTITSKPQTSKRISQMWVYFGKRNPLEKQSEKKNYNSILAKLTENPVVALEDNPPAIRELASRYITTLNLAAASYIAERMITRYEQTIREIGFHLFKTQDIALGDVIDVKSRIFENAIGLQEDYIPCQVISIEDVNGMQKILCQESIFNQIAPPTNDRYIYVTSDLKNINLREAHDEIYEPAQSGDTVILNIASGAIIGSNLVNFPALDIGSWPAGVTIQIEGTGRIQGTGGKGGTATVDGEDGGDALLTTYAVDITGDVEIWSGGGGGGGAFGTGGASVTGGGGAGSLPGAGSPAGTTEAGGDSPTVGDGGDPGQNGANSLTNGGTAGNAIDGFSFITITGSPDIRGTTVG